MSESLAEAGRPSMDSALALVGLLGRSDEVSDGEPGAAASRDLELVLHVLSRLADELQDTTWHLDDYLYEMGVHPSLMPTDVLPGSGVVGSIGVALSQVRRLAGDLHTAITTAELAR